MRAVILLSAILFAIRISAGTVADIEYARVGDLSLKLDLHRPADVEKPKLIVYVHGGAWRAGSRADVPVKGLVAHGFAIASVDYRLSTQARFPGQIQNIKTAIRFLRTKAVEMRLDARRIAIIGSSAGGHLAALTGVTTDHPALEGNLGDHLSQSSRVDDIVSFYGASNLRSILDQNTEFGMGVRIPALKLLLGGLADQQSLLAKLARPVAHLDAKDPPPPLLHGDADPQMPLAQSEEFHREYETSKLTSKLVIIPDAKHGGPDFTKNSVSSSFPTS